MSVPELSRLRLRVASLALWHGCDIQDVQLRSLEFEEKPFHGGQVGWGGYWCVRILKDTRSERGPPLFVALYAVFASANDFSAPSCSKRDGCFSLGEGLEQL